MPGCCRARLASFYTYRWPPSPVWPPGEKVSRPWRPHLKVAGTQVGMTGRSDSEGTNFAALLELSESRFRLWQRKELRPERDRRTKEIEQQHVSIAGRAVLLLRLERELLEKECLQWITVYADVARETGNPDMLSERRLTEFERRVEISVGVGIASLCGRLQRVAHAAGSAPPNRDRFIHLKAATIDAVKVAFRVLKAEAKLAESTMPEPRKRAKLRSIAPAPGEPEMQEQRANRRKEIVMPILRSKNWKPGKWATRAGVGKNSVYEYLDGTRKFISDENRTALAETLGLPENELPH